MPDVSIGRLRDGLCVYWDDPETGRRRRFQLQARTRKEAEAEALKIYRRETYEQSRRLSRVAEIWSAYQESLGDRPTAKTMDYTGKAILKHFGAFQPDHISKEMCEAFTAQRLENGISQGTIWTELGHLRSAMKFAEEVRAIGRAEDLATRKTNH